MLQGIRLFAVTFTALLLACGGQVAITPHGNDAGSNADAVDAGGFDSAVGDASADAPPRIHSQADAGPSAVNVDDAASESGPSATPDANSVVDAATQVATCSHIIGSWTVTSVTCNGSPSATFNAATDRITYVFPADGGQPEQIEDFSGCTISAALDVTYGPDASVSETLSGMFSCSPANCAPGTCGEPATSAPSMSATCSIAGGAATLTETDNNLSGWCPTGEVTVYSWVEN